MSPLRSALLLTAAVWCVLAAGRAAVGWVGPRGSVLGSFSVAVLLVWATRPGRAAGAPGRLRAPWAALSGLGVGFLLFPAWLRVTWHAGLVLGLDPALLGAPVPSLAGGPALWLAGVALAPAFEEPLYRGRLLAALRPETGAPLAIVVASALFALPHVLPWTVLGVFLGGLTLGSVMQLGRSLALCVGLHAGLNLAAVIQGIPGSEIGLRPLPGFVAGASMLAGTLWWLRTDRAAGGGRS